MVGDKPSSEASHQTTRLGPGRHRGPGEVVCVMELSSMLAGERFTDRPKSVCPLIGALLRTYNDNLDDRRRQDLYRFAAEAVGTRGDYALERARAEVALEAAREAAPRRPEPPGTPARRRSPSTSSSRWRAAPTAGTATAAGTTRPMSRWWR